jgi:hypothetical protein
MIEHQEGQSIHKIIRKLNPGKGIGRGSCFVSWRQPSALHDVSC